MTRVFSFFMELAGAFCKIGRRYFPKPEKPFHRDNLLSHPVWLRLTDSGPLGPYLAKKEEEDES